MDRSPRSASLPSFHPTQGLLPTPGGIDGCGSGGAAEPTRKPAQAPPHGLVFGPGSPQPTSTKLHRSHPSLTVVASFGQVSHRCSALQLIVLSGGGVAREVTRWPQSDTGTRPVPRAPGITRSSPVPRGLRFRHYWVVRVLLTMHGPRAPVWRRPVARDPSSTTVIVKRPVLAAAYFSDFRYSASLRVIS